MTQSQPLYFDFESDFVEDGIRCIPMIVRFKLDACGIKLKLREWIKMTEADRLTLAILPVDTARDANAYREIVCNLIRTRAACEPTYLSEAAIDRSWANAEIVPERLETTLQSIGVSINLSAWSSLSVMQRFALVKLAGAEHESKNLKRAVEEFRV